MIKKLKNKKWFYFVLLLMLVIFSKLPTMNLDYHWDAAFTASQAKYYSVYGFLSIPPGSIVHVPFFTLTLAATYKLFGESPFLSNFIVAIFSFIGSYFTYLLGEFLYNKKVGIIASLFLFFSPIYFSISGQAIFDVPLTAMTMATLYFGLRKKIFLYIISGSLLVLTKEPGGLTILALIIYQFFKKEKIYNIVIYAFPLFFLFIWIIWYWAHTGYFLSPGAEVSHQSFLLKVELGMNNLYQIFFWNYNWILTIFILFVFLKRKLFNKKMIQFIPLVLTMVFYWIFFSFLFMPFLPRYLLPISPIFFIFSAFSINYIFKNKSWLISILIILLFISTYTWNLGIKGIIQDPLFHSNILFNKTLTSISNGELSLDYVYTLKAEKSAFEYIFSNYPNSSVIYLAKESAEYIFVNNSTSKIEIGYRHDILLPTEENFKKSDILIYRLDCLGCSRAYNKLLPNIKLLKTFGKDIAVYKLLS